MVESGNIKQTLNVLSENGGKGGQKSFDSAQAESPTYVGLSKGYAYKGFGSLLNYCGGNPSSGHSPVGGAYEGNQPVGDP